MKTIEYRDTETRCGCCGGRIPAGKLRWKICWACPGYIDPLGNLCGAIAEELTPSKKWRREHGGKAEQPAPPPARIGGIENRQMAMTTKTKRKRKRIEDSPTTAPMYITRRQATERHGLSSARVWQLIHDGLLVEHPVPGTDRRMLLDAEVAAWVARTGGSAGRPVGSRDRKPRGAVKSSS